MWVATLQIISWEGSKELKAQPIKIRAGMKPNGILHGLLLAIPLVSYILLGRFGVRKILFRREFKHRFFKRQYWFKSKQFSKFTIAKCDATKYRRFFIWSDRYWKTERYCWLDRTWSQVFCVLESKQREWEQVDSRAIFQRSILLLHIHLQNSVEFKNLIKFQTFFCIYPVYCHLPVVLPHDCLKIYASKSKPHSTRRILVPFTLLRRESIPFVGPSAFWLVISCL